VRASGREELPCAEAAEATGGSYGRQYDEG